MLQDVVIDYSKRARIQIGKRHINKEELSTIVNELVAYTENGEGGRIKSAKRILFPPEMKYESTLYYFELKQGFSLLATIDEDPIFEQMLVKVFSVGTPDKIEGEFERVLFSLTHELNGGLEDEVVDSYEEEDNG